MLTNNELLEAIIQGLTTGDFGHVGKLLKTHGASLYYLLEAPTVSAELREEGFACACFLGLNDDVRAMLNNGVDPAAGIRSGQSGFHYAVMSGHLDTVRLLVERKAPLEVMNQYDATVLGQALWSAINEGFPSHPAIIEELIDAGAHVWPGTVEWWNEQDVTPSEAKEQIANVLKRTESRDQARDIAI